MLNLDIHTLLVVVLFIYFLVATLFLVAAVQGRNSQILWWMTVTLALGSVGVTLGVMDAGSKVGPFMVWLASALTITSHACIWTGIRRFTGKAVSWTGLFAGAVLWAGCCLWPGFSESAALKVVAYSSIALVYTCAALVQLWPEARRYAAAVFPVLLFLAVHALFNVYRLVPRTGPNASWADQFDLTLTLFESLFFTIGLAFTLLAMVRTRTQQHYQQASLHDELTGLSNRRALFERGRAILDAAAARDQDVALLMCDLDWFKHVNDQFGHGAGDEVLVEFARILRAAVRPGDLCARLGGEEFVVLMPDPGAADAEEVAERVRQGLAACALGLPSRQTVSIGIARRGGNDIALDRLLSRADKAMYAAKLEGRDRVQSWSATLAADPSATTTIRRRYRLAEASQPQT